MTDDHHFDRRKTDVSVAALAVRVEGLEGRMELVESAVKINSRELAANTRLTRQVHEMAERTEQNTKDIVAATTWMSTTKKLLVALVLGVGGLAGAATAVIGLMKVTGLWT